MRYLIVGILVLVFLVAVVFAAINTDVITLDLAFMEVQTPVSLAMLGFFAAGWVFGICCLGVAFLKLMNERRQVRRQLRLAEAEVTSLRRMPMQDAN